MSYDINLRDPVTKETINFADSHQMRGGTYVVGGTTEAWLNITYNYSEYYYEATENDPRFFGKLPDDYDNEPERNLGIRGIYGKTGAETLKMISDMIHRIESKYKKDGEWITTERRETVRLDENGKGVSFTEWLKIGGKFREKEVTRMVWEGPDQDYWKDTAGNAVRPLYQLLTFCQLRPDGVWEGD